MNDLDGMIDEFLVETCENLDQLDRDLTTLKENTSNRDPLSSIFRMADTIESTCASLGFPKFETVTHCGENFSGLVLDGKLRVNFRITTALLSLVDMVRQLLATIREPFGIERRS